MKKTYAAIVAVLFLYIVGGNAVTFNIAGKISIKISEIASIILGLMLLKYFLNTKLDGSMCWILAWGILSAVLILVNTVAYKFGTDDLLEAFLYLFRFIYGVLIACVSARYVAEWGKRTEIIKIINFCYIIVCFIGFFQLIFYPVAQDWYEEFYRFGVHWAEPDPHINRLISTYFDPNYLGSCLLLGVAADLYLLRSFRKKGVSVTGGCWKYIVCFFIYAITLLLTQSRSGILGLIILIFVYALMSVDFKNIKLHGVIIAGVTLVAGVYLVFFSGITVFVRIRGALQDTSALARFSSWGKGFEALKDTGFLGVGYNLFGAFNRMMYGNDHIQTSYGNDSSILLILITSGIMGFIIFAAHLISIWRNKQTLKEMKCVILLSLVICNFNNLLFFSVWVYPFYFMIYLFLERPCKREKGLPVNIEITGRHKEQIQ